MASRLGQVVAHQCLADGFPLQVLNDHAVPGEPLLDPRRLVRRGDQAVSHADDLFGELGLSVFGNPDRGIE